MVELRLRKLGARFALELILLPSAPVGSASMREFGTWQLEVSEDLGEIAGKGIVEDDAVHDQLADLEISVVPDPARVLEHDAFS